MSLRCFGFLDFVVSCNRYNLVEIYFIFAYTFCLFFCTLCYIMQFFFNSRFFCNKLLIIIIILIMKIEIFLIETLTSFWKYILYLPVHFINRVFVFLPLNIGKSKLGKFLSCQ